MQRFQYQPARTVPSGWVKAGFTYSALLYVERLPGVSAGAAVVAIDSSL